jgi:hypothetical protein
MDWIPVIEAILLDILFLAVFLLALLQARRLLDRGASVLDLAGHAAVVLLAVGWAMWEVASPAASEILLVLAALASAVPIFRGLRFRRPGRRAAT